jgi:hypothetical protein
MTTFITIVLFLAVSIVCLTLFFLFLFLLRACLRLFIPTKLKENLTGRAIVISAAITAVAFPGTAKTLVIGPISIMLRLFSEFSRSLASGLTGLSEGQGTRAIGDLVLSELDTIVPRFSLHVMNILNEVSIPILAAAAAVFLLSANALSDRRRDDSSLILGVSRWYGTLEPLRRDRLWLGLAVIAGAYLSIAAVLSVPWVYGYDDPGPEDESLLRAQLLAATSATKEWKEQWKFQLFSEDPLEPLRGFIGDTEAAKKARRDYTVAPGTASQASDDEKRQQLTIAAEKNKAILDVTKKFGEIQRAKDEWENQWQARREEAETIRLSSVEGAIEVYRRYKNSNLADRERQIFRDDLTRWYSDIARGADLGLRSFVGRAQWTAARWHRWASITSDAIKSGDIPRYFVETSPPGAVQGVPDVIGDPPVPRDVTLSPLYRFFAKWLIAVRSYTVVMLFGMLGFGLIGSGVARAFSPLRAVTGSEPHRGTGDVILVGVSASMIVFLAALGGLAVFATGESQPNAYILFLAALLGAAYSDRVWETARERFFESLRGEVTDGGDRGEQTIDPASDGEAKSDPSADTAQDVISGTDAGVKAAPDEKDSTDESSSDHEVKKEPS